MASKNNKSPELKYSNDNMSLPDNFRVKHYAGKNTYNCKVDIKPRKLQSIIDNGMEDTKCHEWMTHKSIVKPYYDLDMPYKTEKEMNDNYPLLRDKWTKILNETFKGSFQDIGISICNRYKDKVSKKNGGEDLHWFVSIHLIVNSHSINLGDLGKFNESAGFLKYPEYDDSVYKNGQNFRMLGQSKPDGNDFDAEHTFKPYNFKSTKHKHIIQYTKDSLLGYDKSIKVNNNVEKIELKIEEISPPVSPPSSNGDDENDEIIFNNEYVPEIDFDCLKRIVMTIKNRYEYKYWWKVGRIICKETNGSKEGFKLFKDWSKKDPNYKDFIQGKKQWISFKNDPITDLTIGTLKSWSKEENGIRNDYEIIFHKDITWDEDENKFVGKPNYDGVIKEINKDFIFNEKTGEIITIHLDGTWSLQKPPQFSKLLCKYKFKNKLDSKMVDISTIWLNNINRRQVLSVNFDPTTTERTDIFNLWKGYAITPQISQEFNELDAEPLLYHIKHRWCNGEDWCYEYVMNYLAHILQKPYKKTAVVLCLKSTDEGAGKGLILNVLSRIMGATHYFQCNNLSQVTGDFNGVSEGKILINFDEAFWGKDKQKEGMIKNMITEDTKYINKKNKEQYVIDNHCNYIITTNNDCYAPATEGGRRFFAIELSNEIAGSQTEKKSKIIQELLACPDGAFAKVLYNRDISEFNPRSFRKTVMLQEQIQHNWVNIKKWWFNVLMEGGFKGKNINKGFSNWNKVPKSKKDSFTGTSKEYWGIENEKTGKIAVEKDFLFSNYSENVGGYVSDPTHFYIDIKRFCLGDLLLEKKIQKSNSRKRYIILPNIEDAQKQFNLLQDYEYDYVCDIEGEDDGW